MESCHETGRLARIDATLLSTCESLRAIHARSHATYSFVTHQARIEVSRATKLRRTYLLCGYEAPSLTWGLVEAFYILKDDLPGLPACLKAGAFHTFPFECPEKRFSGRIIVTVAGAAHAHGDTGLRKQSSIGITRILRSAVRMKQQLRCCTPTYKRQEPRRFNQCFLFARPHPPPHHPPQEQIDDDRPV